MKKTLFLLLIMVGCSSDNEPSTSSFYVPEGLTGEYRIQYENLFLIVEDHRVRFNTVESQPTDVDITDAIQMATEYNYVTLRLNNDYILYMQSMSGGNGIRLEYYDENNDLVFYGNYCQIGENGCSY